MDHQVGGVGFDDLLVVSGMKGEGWKRGGKGYLGGFGLADYVTLGVGTRLLA